MKQGTWGKARVLWMALALLGMTIEIGLAEEARRLDDVVVTATKYETAIKDVPASVTVVSSSDLANQNLPNSDIGDALRSVPGIALRRAYAPFPPYANIRGAGSGGTVYLVNGIPTDWQISQAIAVELVERVEIIRGPASALYGADATGGVINIILKSGGETPTTTVKGGAGSFGRYRGAAEADGKVDRFSYAIAGYYEEADGTNVVENNVNASVHMIDDCDYDKHGVDANVGYRFSDSAGLRFFYDYGNNKYTRGRPHVGGDWDYNLAGLLYDQQIGNRLTINAYLGLRSDDYLHLYDQGGTDYDPRQKRDMDYSEMPAELRATAALGGHTLTIGAYYNNQETEQKYKDWTSGALLRENEYSVRTMAGYAQDVWKITDAMTLTAGLRYDHWENYDNYFSNYNDQYPDDRTDDHLSPKIGLRYNFAGGTSIWGNYSTGFTPPTSDQLYNDQTSGGNPRIPNPNLDPETTQSFELGLQHWFGTRFQASLAGFYTYTEDKILSWFNADNVYINQNIGRTESYGVELDLAWYLTENWTVTANYTYNEATVDENPEDPDLEGNDIPFCPKHKANLGVTYSQPSNFSISLYARYLSKQYSDDANTDLAGSGDDLAMEESLVFDIKGTKHFLVAWGPLKTVDLSLSIDNLFDEEYRTMYMYEDPGTTFFGEVKFVF
ncbi:iron-regulated outer membrane virulence protein [Desulfosarcina ovata subsp. sediminis]|uniref:Iron-regulated outer membrane virulence protein n=1 Tax=Desulfosarcina ovata subsp. sediminis TaxID=885957 RepID=A0A5K7ZMA7_9BACT|nr:TonB-dependent receptor [Desulfosarcina ovata]BBO82326.1 iron-regulated outer membrane virulence protein [Desulfosarcina ovata subsp. sediminis]